MNPFNKLILFMILLDPYMIMCDASIFHRPHRTVSVLNGLETTGENIIADCKFVTGLHKPAHLHNIIARDHIMNYNFRDGLIGTTKLYCSFLFSGQNHDIKIFDSDRDDCRQCNWIITSKYNLACMLPLVGNQTCLPWS